MESADRATAAAEADRNRGAQTLAGRRVLVTGASSGLGEHFARLCASHGARVAVAARRRDRIEALAQSLADVSGAEAAGFSLDVTDKDAVDACVAGVVDRFGGIDVLVNNAGISGAGPALDQERGTFDHVIDTNLRGVWAMALAAAESMRREGTGGSIVNIASILGFRQATGLAAYSVSKAGVVQMTKALALEWARYGIRVNGLAPGYFETEINTGFFETEAGERMMKRIPMRRLGRLEDLDAPFLLLAGDGSAFMTGTILTVDGGHLLSNL
ncbi:MAG: glucose 1-dehydrogenase [Pseudomonadota bacterium]